MPAAATLLFAALKIPICLDVPLEPCCDGPNGAGQGGSAGGHGDRTVEERG